MPVIAGHALPENRFYDIDNQIWYEPLPGGDIKAGFTPLAIDFVGDVLVFTPRRLGKEFDAGRSLATIEGGKWVGAARSCFDGRIVAANDALIDQPSLLNTDALGAGWMVVVRAAAPEWRAGLVTGEAIAPAFAAWLASGAYKDRSS